LPLIELTKSYDLIYQWFKYLTQQGSFQAMFSPQNIKLNNFPASSLQRLVCWAKEDALIETQCP
jgi:hypothetical protein